jgi:hypothetical protein
MAVSQIPMQLQLDLAKQEVYVKLANRCLISDFDKDVYHATPLRCGDRFGR